MQLIMAQCTCQVCWILKQHCCGALAAAYLPIT